MGRILMDRARNGDASTDAPHPRNRGEAEANVGTGGQVFDRTRRIVEKRGEAAELATLVDPRRGELGPSEEQGVLAL
jgi:hypothetical protein